MPASDLVVGAIAVLAALIGRAAAPRTGIPYAVFLVIVGGAGSFLPGVAPVRLNPRVVFLVILPPLVYYAGFVTSPRELRQNAAAIALSAFGLVLATTFAVAALAQAAIPAFGWAGAVVLGAAVAPTDPVSATTILGRVGAPRRITTILEGEGLVNDGIALTLLSVGIAAVGSATGPASALADFVKVAAGGVLFGAVVGLAMAQARRIGRDSLVQLVLSLVTPYLAYVGADELGLSGILAAVVAGLWLGQAAGLRFAGAARLQAESFWETATFLLESWLFVLVGLQFRFVVEGVSGYPLHVVLEVGAAAVGASVVTRMAWQLAIPSLRWRPSGRLVDTGTLRLGERIVLGWSGLRGAISLAAALSVPTTVDGRRFPDRPLVLLATFCVIAVTLLGQGSTLRLVIRAVHAGADEHDRQQGLLARRHSLQAALDRLAELATSDEVPDEVIGVLTSIYEHRLERARSGLEQREAGPSQQVQDIQRELLAVQRQSLRELFRSGEIDYAVLRQALHDLDLEQAAARRR